MAAIVGINAKVELSTNGTVWTEITERNEFSISINVDSAEHKVFVATMADAWVEKARTWMSWSGSLSGYYDDASDAIFDTVVAGNTIYLRFYDDRQVTTKYWQGQAILTSVEHGVNTDDFATLSVDFEGQGALDRVSP
jgi:hypothetical protein